MQEHPRTYKEAGVDIAFLSRLKLYGQQISEQTRTKYIKRRGDTFVIDGTKVAPDFPHPQWFVETDGIGTKEEWLLKAGKFYTAGWDLVVANVHDILRHGATPIGMSIDVKLRGLSLGEFKEFMDGVGACLGASGCALLGGETAIHPRLTEPGKKAWHLSGTAIGTATKERVVTSKTVRDGDIILGLASSGIHTNGTNLAVSALENTLHDPARLELLLTPSKLYVKSILELLDRGLEVHGLVHITGGGLTDRISKLMPTKLCAVIDRSNWVRPGIFELIGRSGKISTFEMYRTFNMGIGFVAVAPPPSVREVKEVLGQTEIVFEIGKVETSRQKKLIYI